MVEKKRTEEKRGKRASYAHRECFDSKRVLVSLEWAKNLCPHLFLQLRLQNQCTVRRLEATTRVRTPRSCLRPLFLRWCRCPIRYAKTSGKTRLHRIERKNNCFPYICFLNPSIAYLFSIFEKYSIKNLSFLIFIAFYILIIYIS